MEAKTEMKKEWKYILSDFLVAGVVASLLDALKNGAKKAGDKAVEKIISKMDERRGEMLAFIRGLVARDKEASETLIKRQHDRQFCRQRSYGEKKQYLPGDEDTYVTLLTKLYIALDESDEEIARQEIFVWLGRISDEDFDATIEFLHHDIFVQWLKRSWISIKNKLGIFGSVPASLRKAGSKTLDAGKKIDRVAGDLGTRWSQNIQNRKPSWLARFIK